MKRLSRLPSVAAFLALFLASYHSVLTGNYAILDSYNAVLNERLTPFLDSFRIGLGRPLDAAWSWFVYRLATEIEHLQYVRFAGILGIALLAWSVYLTLLRAGYEKLHAFCLSAVMGLSLPFQVYSAWAATSNYPLSALLAALALPLSNRAFETRRRAPKWSLAAGAVLLLFAGIAVYQPSGMFFWVVAAAVLLKADRPLRDLLRRFGWHLMVASASMSLALAASRIGAARNPISPRYFDLASNFAAKAEWFLLDAFPNALNFAWLSPSLLLFPAYESGAVSPAHRTVDVSVAWLIFIVTSIGLFVYFQGARRERAWKYAVAVSILVLSYAPNLLSVTSQANYRTLPALTCLGVLYAYFALLGCRRRLRSPFGLDSIMAGAVIVCAMSAAYHVRTYFVIPQVRELESMRRQVEALSTSVDAPHDWSTAVAILPPAWGATCAPIQKHEFGAATSHYRPSSEAAALLVIQEILPAVQTVRLSFESTVPAPSRRAAGRSRAVVDMRDLGCIPQP